MRELLHNNEIYKKYKEDKAKKEEAEIIASKKGKLDIKSLTNIPRYNQFEEEPSDSEESSESVKVVGLKLNTNMPKTEGNASKGKDNSILLNIQSNGKVQTEVKEEKKQEEKVEEKKEPEKTEEEIQKEKEYQQKLKENEEKRKKADLVLSKALKNFDFDDDDDNEEEEEF